MPIAVSYVRTVRTVIPAVQIAALVLNRKTNRTEARYRQRSDMGNFPAKMTATAPPIPTRTISIGGLFGSAF